MLRPGLGSLGKLAARWAWELQASCPGSALCQHQAWKQLSSTSSTPWKRWLPTLAPASAPKFPSELGMDHNFLAPRPDWKEGGPAETAGVSVCSAEDTQGGAGRTCLSGRVPSRSSDIGDRPTDQAPSLSSEQGRHHLNLPRNAHWHAGKDLYIAAIRGSFQLLFCSDRNFSSENFCFQF